MLARIALVVASAATAPACIIGTWPVPEAERSDEQQPGQPLGEESCDGQDNDGDGSVDEGCPCTGRVRGCVAVNGEGHCGFGTQVCSGGTWLACGDFEPPLVPRRTTRVLLDATSPPSLLRGDTSPLLVQAEPIAACDGIIVPGVEVALAARSPAMRVRATARDDGVAPDVAANDGIYTVRLPNAFGPGVAAQDLDLTISARLSDQEVTAHQVVPLEDP